MWPHFFSLLVYRSSFPSFLSFYLSLLLSFIFGHLSISISYWHALFFFASFLSFSHLITHICFWLCLSSFKRAEIRFNIHYQNAYANAFLELLRLSSISQYREYKSWGRHCHCAAALRSLIRRHMPLRRSVGDIKAFQNNFAFIISTETCFWLKRVSDHIFFRRFRKAFLTP